MISLIHPSRGRAEKSFANVQNWISKSGAHATQIEVIVSVDASDPQLTKYLTLYKDFTILINDNTSVVEATNKAAEHSKGDILIYLSDDFDCPVGWWSSVSEHFNTTEPRLLKVNDCLQDFVVAVLTIPIMNRVLYERLGYFWHPGYKSMFVDEDLFWSCKNMNCIKSAPELKFPHLHCSIGKAERDDTYIRSESNWNQGKVFFAHRKANGFPV